MSFIAHTERMERKRAMATFLSQREYRFHVTLSLFGATTFTPMKTAVSNWNRRLTEYFGGRRASSPHRKHLRMTGAVCFERGPNQNSPHAHVLLIPAPGVADADFAVVAPWVWSSRQPMPLTPQPRCRITPVTVGGTIHVQSIRNTRDDRIRTINYVLKEMERGDYDDDALMFLDDLFA